MASKCTKCGDTDNYNFALNIGLCNPCIGEKLEELEAKLEIHRWIPVSERLPEQTGYYLIICASEDYNEHRWWQFWYQDGWYEYNKREDCIEDTERTVTHWKPVFLPEQALKPRT